MSSKELQLVGVGSVTGAFLKELEAPIAAVLSVGAFVGKTAMPGPAYAFNKDRSQYHSAAIMRRVLTVREIGSPLVMGITDVDLFMPDTPFVFGDADRDSHVAVFSLNRLKGEGEAWKRRTFVEAVHQAGHLVGLSYCEDVRCAMYQATSITDADRRQLHLCNNCRNELVKLRR